MDELIKKLKSDPDFIEFTQFILQKIDELDTVGDLDQLPNEQAGEEAKIRAKTKQRLYEIIRPFIEFKEKREPTEAEIKSARSRFGLS